MQSGPSDGLWAWKIQRPLFYRQNQGNADCEWTGLSEWSECSKILVQVCFSEGNNITWFKARKSWFCVIFLFKSLYLWPCCSNGKSWMTAPDRLPWERHWTMGQMHLRGDIFCRPLVKNKPYKVVWLFRVLSVTNPLPPAFLFKPFGYNPCHSNSKELTRKTGWAGSAWSPTPFPKSPRPAHTTKHRLYEQVSDDDLFELNDEQTVLPGETVCIIWAPIFWQIKIQFKVWILDMGRSHWAVPLKPPHFQRHHFQLFI